MITYLAFTDILSNTLEFSVGESPSVDYYPVEYFDPAVESRLALVERMQDHGYWPAWTYLNGMSIEIHGSIFGSTSAEYMERRKVLRGIILPKDLIPPTEVKVGTLDVIFDDDPFTIISIDVGLKSNSFPMEGLSPSYSHFQIIWQGFDAFFRDITGDAVVV